MFVARVALHGRSPGEVNTSVSVLNSPTGFKTEDNLGCVSHAHGELATWNYSEAIVRLFEASPVYSWYLEDVFLTGH